MTILRAHERQLKEAGIVRLSVFGSTARNDAGPDSDVDLLAAFDDTRRISLLDIVGMENDLSDLLGCKVDLIEEGTLKPRVQKSVEAEVVRAFSRPSTAFIRIWYVVQDDLPSLKIAATAALQKLQKSGMP